MPEINMCLKYLLFFADEAELKAPGMSPNPTENLKVLEQICSNPHLRSSHGAHTWKNIFSGPDTTTDSHLFYFLLFYLSL